MDHIRIIKRAFDITRIYRALWVFGIFLALGSSRGGGGNGSGWRFDANDRTFRNLPFTWPNIPHQVGQSLIAGGIALACIFLILVVIFTVLRYISLTASVRMVDRYEASGERVTVGEGFRLGWSRGAFLIWLTDLLVGLAGFIAFILMLGLAAAPLLLWLTKNETVGIIGTVATVGLAVLVILTFILVAILLSLLLQIVRRAVILEGLGIIEGIRRGWAMVQRKLGDVVIMGLILFGLGLAFAIVMIPVVIILLAVGAVAGGLPGLLAGAITNIFVHGSVPQVVGVIVGLPIFLAVLIIPITFITALYEIFTSSTWTLTYRELRTLDAVRAEPAPPQTTPA